MQLFDKNRPEVTNGTKRLLLDTSIVPSIMVFPHNDGEGFQLSVMLRAKEANTSFSYSWKHCYLLSTELELFFLDYRADPEDTLERYFGWKDQLAPLKHQTQPQTKPTYDPLANLT